MNPLIEMTGQKIGRLTVVGLHDDVATGTRWVCKCDCGRSVVVAGTRLRSGHKTSCGCEQRERSREPDNAVGDKKCGRCDEVKPITNFCRDKGRSDGRWAYCRPCQAAQNKETWDRRKAKGLPTYSAVAHRKLRLEVLLHYSGGSIKCACCGETRYEFMSLDHINNDGAEHRRVVGPTGVLQDLKKRGFPPGYQVLCHNCNIARQHFGCCPHQKEQRIAA